MTLFITNVKQDIISKEVVSKNIRQDALKMVYSNQLLLNVTVMIILLTQSPPFCWGRDFFPKIFLKGGAKFFTKGPIIFSGVEAYVFWGELTKEETMIDNLISNIIMYCLIFHFCRCKKNVFLSEIEPNPDMQFTIPIYHIRDLFNLFLDACDNRCENNAFCHQGKCQCDENHIGNYCQESMFLYVLLHSKTAIIRKCQPELDGD